MDIRDQLRRYLEQRREMGETELVLDSLAVEDALRLLGAPATQRSVSDSPISRMSEPTPSFGRTEAMSGVTEPVTDAVNDAVKGAAKDAVLPTGGDWREALRATGASPEGLVARQPAKSVSPEAPQAPPLTPSTSSASSASSKSAKIDGQSNDSLDALAAEIAKCTKCPLYATATNPVPGEGNPHADLMCVGEAPGATEDETGRPFVGAAGQLLTKILEAIQLPREQVYICNVLKHRPPGNRNPLPEEVTACSPYLVRQIELVRPKVILALGSFAAQTLLNSKLSLGKLRGEIHQYHGVPVVVTYHPAALLRNPSWKRPTWEDVQLARRILDSANQPGA